MGTIGIWALFVAFGAISALYVTVVGFAVSSVALVGLLGLFAALLGGGVTGWLLWGSLVALQVGYAACLVASAMIGQTWRAPVKDPPPLKGDLHVNHD
jgi:hypothetical protein